MYTVKNAKKFRVPLDVITLTLQEYEDQNSLIAGTIRNVIALPTTPAA